jgi:hypothetical protein
MKESPISANLNIGKGSIIYMRDDGIGVRSGFGHWGYFAGRRRVQPVDVTVS